MEATTELLGKAVETPLSSHFLALFSALNDAFDTAQQGLFEQLVQPLAFGLGLGNLLEQAYAGTGWLLAGLVQLVVMLAIIAPWQALRPVEVITDRATVWVDVAYTLIHRLGLFKLVMFFTVEALLDQAWGSLRGQGLPTLHLDQIWPLLSAQPLLGFVVYLVVFDALQYAIHRAQHQFEWWWALHSLHHAQRQMTQWSDNRNHFLDDALRDSIVVVVAWAIGVPPAQFVALVAVTQLSESFQHANIKLGFGQIGERLWVSPRFHRLHHSIGLGHESNGRYTLGGCNFGVLLPWWDMLCRTANFEWRFDATGVRDQLESGRDYGRGLWQQQWLGLKRLVGRA
jgi:sterol desaturase/sphingolipid hydroxylase (fatty acid hydroxylase superfamily)